MTFPANRDPLTDRSGAEDVIPSYSDGGGTTDDDKRIERWILEGSKRMRQLADRQFHYETAYTERTSAHGEREIWVNDHVPIDTINSITYDSGDDTTTVDSDSYEPIGDGQGTIRRIDGLWTSTAQIQAGIVQGHQPGTEERLYKVDYDGGWITPKQDTDGVGTRDLPHDVEGAVLDYALMKESRHGQDPNIQKLSLGQGTVQYGGFEVPQRMAAVADSYKLRGVL